MEALAATINLPLGDITSDQTRALADIARIETDVPDDGVSVGDTVHLRFTGGLTGGEVAVAGGTTAVGQRVLDDTLKMDIYGGLRYTRLRANLDVVVDTSLARFPGDSSSFKSEKDWTDYVMGMNLAYPISGIRRNDVPLSPSGC